LQDFGRRLLGLEEPCLNGGRHPTGNHLEQLHFSRDKVSLSEPTDVENPEKVSSGDEGNAQHRLDALLPENGVGHRRLVDPVENDWPSIGGDPTGEADANGYSHSLANFLFYPSR
jgi:hypothetical protein